MIYYILVLIVILVILYLLLPSTVKNTRLINRLNTEVFTNPSKKVDSICGKRNLYCKNRLIRPYMFRNLAKEYVDNHNIDWNIELLDASKNLYRMNLSNRYCAYNIDNDICLYEVNESDKQPKTTGCKKINLCSLTDVIDNTPHYDPTNTQFIIRKVESINTPETETGYTIQTLDDKYVCNLDNRMSLSSEFSDDCIWQFK
jgi:hypothetical protein